MTRLNSSSPNFADCLTVGEAAEFLGVSTATLRNWDRNGKLKPRRHPQNGYRIYLHEDLEAVLRSADLSTLTDDSFAPQVDWTKMRDDEHFVQFYESDEYLIECVSGFIGGSVREGGTSVVVATPEHRTALDRKLHACGIDTAEAAAAGRYIALDACEVLSEIMVDGMPDVARVNKAIGGLLTRLAEKGRHIHAFGEMVALLWADGNRDAAIRLEELWNELAHQHRFALFCAYPISSFENDPQAVAFDGVCSCHSRVIPAESYVRLDKTDQQMRAISLLQQKAQSLQAEIEHRKGVEQALTQSEMRLVEADRHKDEFLATLSHELRNSLAPIRNALELLEGEPTISSAGTVAVDAIRCRIEHLLRLIDDRRAAK